MITHGQTENINEENIEILNKNELVDISNIHIREDLSYNKKILDFLEQIKNPHCFLCDDIPVKICFSDNGAKLSDILQDYFIRIKQS